MSIFRGTFFEPHFNPLIIKSVGELIENIQHPSLPDSADGLVRMWRGQGNVRWPIHSSAYRRLSKDGAVSNDGLIAYERGLLESATFHGYRHRNGRNLNDMELLALLQHHGAATRLIDASKNALVALWFCCASEPDEAGVLLGLHCNYLHGYEGESEDRSYEQVVLDLNEMDGPATWESPISSNRLAAQHSQFLYSAIHDDALGSLKIAKNAGAIIGFVVEPKTKPVILEALAELFDIRRYTLFPDLDGFCAANSVAVGRYANHRW